MESVPPINRFLLHGHWRDEVGYFFWSFLDEPPSNQRAITLNFVVSQNPWDVSWGFTRPGKHTKNYGKIHHFVAGKNNYFDWAMASIAMLVITRPGIWTKRQPILTPKRPYRELNSTHPLLELERSFSEGSSAPQDVIRMFFHIVL